MTIEYSEMISVLVKPGNDIQDSLTGSSINFWHMATGISGEAGELLDAVKKHVIYNKTLDVDNVIEELGDLEFYMEGLRQALKITREETIQKNIEKLSVRYHGLTYSDQKAQERADKNGN
ncbi:MAG: nucleotide pyrophosphohydrolase [Alphaproteobacteria bacterium]|nr:nucleotide pyrophosphohydrolase [Alphaproteobacteria bacterium]